MASLEVDYMAIAGRTTMKEEQQLLPFWVSEPISTSECRISRRSHWAWLSCSQRTLSTFFPEGGLVKLVHSFVTPVVDKEHDLWKLAFHGNNLEAQGEGFEMDGGCQFVLPHGAEKDVWHDGQLRLMIRLTPQQADFWHEVGIRHNVTVPFWILPPALPCSIHPRSGLPRSPHCCPLLTVLVTERSRFWLLHAIQTLRPNRRGAATGFYAEEVSLEQLLAATNEDAAVIDNARCRLDVRSAKRRFGAWELQVLLVDLAVIPSRGWTWKSN